jgi:putative transposase
MTPIIAQLWEDNYRVYGARKLWKAANRTGYDIGRDQVAVSAQCRPSPGP